MTSPTQRTLAYLREQGVLAQKVEYWNSFAKRRVDLFGWCDVVAVTGPCVEFPLGGVYFIQCCTGGDHATRRSKIQVSQTLAPSCDAGVHVEVWSWAKQGARGKRKTWKLRREELRP